MADDGAAAAPAPASHSAAQGENPNAVHDAGQKRTANGTTEPEEIKSPISAEGPFPNPYSRRETSLDLDDYFVGPRDMSRHSKWPVFLRLHGSIMPKMVVPLFVMGLWSSAITVCSMVPGGRDLGINSVLLTVLGFVVGLGLSFRSSTAYERYSEGRRYFGQLTLASQALGRVFWIHSRVKKDLVNEETCRQHLLQTLSASNLIVLFSRSLMHKLRFEPYTAYSDMEHLAAHLHTFAGTATQLDPAKAKTPRAGLVKEVGNYLGLAAAASNPRKALKKATAPLGNVPLETLNYLGKYIDFLVENGKLPVPMQQTLAYNNLAALNDILTGTERVLMTPLPIAYTIAISQITWLYVVMLPFQLVGPLDWIAIPATVVASYIILGILFIGQEIENPFGTDVNDLPLDAFCEQIESDLDIMAAHAVGIESNFVAHLESPENRPMYPVSSAPYTSWGLRSEARLREAIMRKPQATFDAQKAHEEKVAHPHHGVHGDAAV